MVKYESYQEYLDHQREKTSDPLLRQRWLGEEWELKLGAFRRVFAAHAGAIGKNQRTLCLGARTGQEVVALREMGVDAIGVDLVPREPLVLEADFHRLPFSDGSFGFVFSNSYDHALYPDVFASEIERVLKDAGHVLLHFQIGKPVEKSNYDVTYIADSGEARKLFHECRVLVDRAMDDPLGMNWECLLQRQPRASRR